MATHGKNTFVQMDDASGTLFDLTVMGKDSGLQRSVDTADASHFGVQDKEYVVGQSDATFSISGLYDSATDAKITAAYDAQNAGTLPSITVVYGPEGKGKPATRQEMLLTGYDVTASVGDLVQGSLNFQRTGPTTKGTLSTAGVFTAS